MLWRIGDLVHVPSEEDFWKHVDKGVTELGCWLWQGGVRPGGSTRRVSFNGVELDAWALAWQLVGRSVEPCSVGVQVCPVPGCINPDHWSMRYRFEESGVGWGGPSHCDWGHPLAGANLVIRMARGDRERTCLACDRANKMRWSTRRDVLLPLPPLAQVLDEVRENGHTSLMRRYGLSAHQSVIYAKMVHLTKHMPRAHVEFLPRY